ncbi:hypothetical protein BG452_43325 [Streptomyces sp. CBMA123]|nr:hypothetical protein [Streptomyces sp. CBMA123]
MVLATVWWTVICFVSVFWTIFATEHPPWHGYYALLWVVGLPWGGPVLGAALTRGVLRRTSLRGSHWAEQEALIATGALVGLAIAAALTSVLSALP